MQQQDLTQIKFNKVTQEQYNQMEKVAGEFYFITNAPSSLDGTLTLVDANGDTKTFTGVETIDLSSGIAYAKEASDYTEGGAIDLAIQSAQGDITDIQSDLENKLEVSDFNSETIGNSNGANLDVVAVRDIVNNVAIKTQKITRYDMDRLLQNGTTDPNTRYIVIDDVIGTNVKQFGTRNVGDIFYTMRLEAALNGAVACDGSEYNTADYVGEQAIGALLSQGKLPYLSYADYASEIAAHGVCGKFAYDGGTTFKVPTLEDVYIEASNTNVADFDAESLPNITGHHAGIYNSINQDGCLYGVYGSGTDGGTCSPSTKALLYFDASRSSSTYKNGAKVKTDRIKYRAMIQLATQSTDEAIMDTIALRNEVDDKAGFYTGILDALGYTIGGSKPRFLQYNTARTLKILANTSIKLGTYGWWRTNEDLVVNCETILGSTLAAATEYYLYLCHNGTDFLLQLSTNSSNPVGFDNTNSIKIGWFHTQGVSIPSLTYVWASQTLTHPYSNMQAGDIDFNSVWCPTFRPVSDLAFMNYIEPLNIAVGCFLQSGTGLNTKCSPNQTITDTRIYALHQEDALSVKCRFPSQREFALFADGSNQLTNIAGGADPGTTGYHKDTAGRYMISRFGLWDCCGALWQFINSDIANGGSGWNAQGGSKGNIYGNAPVLLAGGAWGSSSNCGSYSLSCSYGRLTAGAGISARLVSEIESKQAI